jgi:spore coat protein CotH
MKKLFGFFFLWGCSLDFTGEPLPPLDEESMPRPVNEADAIFDDTKIHEISITLGEAEFEALLQNKELEVRAEVKLNDEATLEDVGLKLRGNLGSFLPIDQKPKLSLDFNEFVPGRLVHGLEKLSFNNERQDCSFLREPLGYRVFSLAGVPSPRTGFAHVTLNGEDYGFYILVEPEDDRFLAARYENSNGNLYDGKYRRDKWPFQRLDFNIDRDALFELEEGSNVSHRDIIAVSNALKKSHRHDLLGGTSQLIDWGEAMRFFISESWIAQQDGYTTFRNNYRIYFDPSDGRVDFMPFDIDSTFGNTGRIGTSGKLSNYCLKDATCAATLAGTAAQVAERIDPNTLLAWFDAVDALTLNVAQNDPKRECPAEQILSERLSLRDWIQTRNETLLDEWNQ